LAKPSHQKSGSIFAVRFVGRFPYKRINI